MNDRMFEIQEAANFLGVSSATVKNWIKHGYLKPLDGETKIIFERTQVEALKERIKTGEIKRLTQRANKRRAERSFIPDEQIPNKEAFDKINKIITFAAETKSDISEKMFYLSLNLLKRRGFLFLESPSSINEESAYKKKELYYEISKWMLTLQDVDDELLNNVLSLAMPDAKDTLGVLYQSLLVEGEKAKKGSYYTPVKIIDDIVRELGGEKKKVLDPCCGTGQFLLGFSSVVKDPALLYGYDIDPVAVHLARINLIMKYENLDFSPNVFCRDSLLPLDDKKNAVGDFDLVATNPPWGFHFDQTETKRLKSIHKDISSGESFSYFIKNGIERLKPEGTLSFILPESILNVSVHSDIRKIILEKTRISKVVSLGRIFKNVFSPVIRLDLNASHSSSSALIVKKNESYEIDALRFNDNDRYTFEINIKDEERTIIDKVYDMRHLTLKDNARWALGIVTGDNEKFLSDKQKPGFEKVYKGSDIKKFIFSDAKIFINFEPKAFQQCAPEKLYRAKEKLVYKFISKHLVFAYDDKARLTLNSANIVIPSIEDYPIKTIGALFNSSLYNFIFMKKFSSIKVLRSHLEELPLPILQKEEYEFIEKCVDRIISDAHPAKEPDEYIFKLFGITEDEKKHILNSI